ncbi:hypothetical protein M9194_06685 [Vibrio sp. S4M6]|uniref:hypothetical protein n=1 Tax=Vibrio sinus TaxID=2946865 RepID=UPI00202A88CF|nr:hypothetical protein [Vibrio sinus]MCL9781110.1 hypothetical protein [Vibrio sinus]
MKTVMYWLPLAFCFPLQAEDLPNFPSEKKTSPHKLFVSSENNTQSTESYKIDSGYSYNIFNKVDLYIGARIDRTEDNNDPKMIDGLLSGLSYQLTENISVKSTLRSYTETVYQDNATSMAAEVSSRMKITDNLDVHATLDYQEWRQGIEVGIGFRF